MFLARTQREIDLGVDSPSGLYEDAKLALVSCIAALINVLEKLQ
jgi:hypothetical protein